MPERYRLVKLVRDRVAQFNRAEGVRYEPVSPEQHRELIVAKVGEEALEFVQNPTLAELADVQQAVEDAAVILFGDALSGRLAVKRKQAEKALERGGFREGIGMFVRTDNSRSPHEDGATYVDRPGGDA